MALITCRACSKEYYEFADKCQNCATPPKRLEFANKIGDVGKFLMAIGLVLFCLQFLRELAR
jgi:hypothetical protein